MHHTQDLDHGLAPGEGNIHKISPLLRV